MPSVCIFFFERKGVKTVGDRLDSVPGSKKKRCCVQAPVHAQLKSSQLRSPSIGFDVLAAFSFIHARATSSQERPLHPTTALSYKSRSQAPAPPSTALLPTPNTSAHAHTTQPREDLRQRDAGRQRGDVQRRARRLRVPAFDQRTHDPMHALYEHLIPS